jgi:uracil-DNA glycosylase
MGSLNRVAQIESLLAEIRACRHCAASLPQGPRPIVQAGRGARILIIGQAPGSKVHSTGVPWDDDSGDRLRQWTGLPREVFYDSDRVALMPMGLCYPGKGNGGDLPPRPECAPLWHAPLLAQMPELKLTLLVGRYAQARYWPADLRPSVTEAVRNYAKGPEAALPLPHPAWRSRLWMAKNPWFEADVLPVLREKVAAALGPQNT